MNKLNKSMKMAVNAVKSEIRSIRSDMAAIQSDPKHCNFYKEMGVNESLTFRDLFSLYDREGVTFGAINTISDKCFETNPVIIEGDESEENTEQTPTDKELKLFAKRTKLWKHFKEADKRRMVGEYSCLVIQIKDDQNWSTEAEKNLNPEDIAGFLPVWQENITVSHYEQDTFSPRYGMPIMYSFNEYSFDSQTSANHNPGRAINIHWTRVILLGDTYQGRSLITAPYNSLKALEKITLSGGEGVYKNAASHLNMNFSKEVKLNEIAKMYGVKLDELSDVIGEQVDALNQSFDSALITQDADTKVLSVTLPDMRESFDNALATAAAGFMVASTLIIGMQKGERASSEDQKGFNKRCTSRRQNELIPDIDGMLEHLQSLGLWQNIELSIAWDSLLEASETEKLENAFKMADINQKMLGTGDLVFTHEEIRVKSGAEAVPDGDVAVQGEEG